MSKFIQMHILTSYPASNLNRDDLGRPKTVFMGNTERLRVSSQSIKRAWRTSDVFKTALEPNMGKRTKELGVYIKQALMNGVNLEFAMDEKGENGLSALKENKAHEIACAIAGAFGKNKKIKGGKKNVDDVVIEQLAFITPSEIKAVSELVEVCRESGKVPEKDDLAVLRKDNSAADVALFGRMLASSPTYNIDAAAQVAHPFTVHTAAVEEDFFTAVDDLNREDSGAGHMGVAEFGAGLFYLYLCVDRDLLLENLDGDEELCAKTLKALCRAACTVSPTGKQNSFASRANASYCLAEKGDAHPRQLSVAYLKPLDESGDLLAKAVESLTVRRDNFGKVYGDTPKSVSFNAETGEGNLDAVCDFVAE